MESHDGDQRDPVSLPAVPGGLTSYDEVTTSQPDLIEGIALLGLGLFLEGSNLVMRYAGLSQADGSSSQDNGSNISSAQLTRHALIGLLVESRARARARRAAVRQARRQFVARVSSAVAPLTHRFPVDVSLALADILTGYGRWKVESTVDRLAEQGWIEEVRARALAQRAFDSLVDEALAYFARNPAVRELVVQQSEEAAAGALDDLRMRAQSADTWLAQFTRRVLQRATRAPGSIAAEPDRSVANAIDKSGA